MATFQKKRGKTAPAISTASLPDIIFMLLFFFMVVTVLRSGEQKVAVTIPQATELQKLEQKSLVNDIYVGRPVEKYKSTYGTKPIAQLGDKFVRAENLESEIPLFLEKHREKVPEVQHPRITSNLKVDQKVTMGIVQDVKTALRKANQLKVSYSANQRATN